MRGRLGKHHALAETEEEAIELSHFSNLTPRLIVAHRVKTKVDVKEIAKTKRITAEQQEFQQRLLAKATGQEAPVKRKGSSMAGGRDSAYKRKVGGGVVKR